MYDVPVPPIPGRPAGPPHRGRQDAGPAARPGSRGRIQRRPAATGAAAWPESLPGGEEVVVRRIGPRERAAAGELHERCSPATLAARYHGPVGDADRYLAHLLDPRHGQTLAVESRPGRPVGIGHLLWDGDEAEVALLVEDAWQRRGVGTLLLRRLVALAGEHGRETLYAVTRPSDGAMAAALRGLGLPLSRATADGAAVLTLSLGKSANAGEMPVVCGRN